MLLLEIQTAQIAIVLLCNRACLKCIGFQLCLCFAGIHNQHGEQKHTLILGLQFLQEGLGVVAIGGQIRRDDIHVVAGSDGFFLLLNFAAVQFRNGVLDGLDGLVLIHALDMHGNNLTGLHFQEVLQHLVTEVGRCDLQVGHSAIHAPHLKYPTFREGEGRGGNKILHRKAGFH